MVSEVVLSVLMVVLAPLRDKNESIRIRERVDTEEVFAGSGRGCG